MANRVDMPAGTEFGDYYVLERAPQLSPGNAKWICQCKCGSVRVVSGVDLRLGKAKSCGCTRAEFISKIKTTHGCTGTRLYRIWRNMLARCHNPKLKCFHNYGGRGIRVCDDWTKFEPFLNWAKYSGYAENLSIDRIDNGGNYSPSNCRWATLAEQARNTRRNRVYSIGGVTKVLKDWATGIGVDQSIVARRLNKGWEIKRALAGPWGE